MALARALLTDPRILVLDDATSAVPPRLCSGSQVIFIPGTAAFAFQARLSRSLGLVKTHSGQDDRPSRVNRRGAPRVAKESCKAEVGGQAMSLAALANSGILSLAAAFWVVAELVWALWPGAWKTPDEPEGATAPGPDPVVSQDSTRWKAWGMTGVIAKLGSSRGGEFAALSWEWIMRTDGQVSYRLAAVDGHREHNPWMDVTRLPATESRLLRHDHAQAVSRLAEFARQRGHEVDGRRSLCPEAARPPG